MTNLAANIESFFTKLDVSEKVFINSKGGFS